MLSGEYPRRAGVAALLAAGVLALVACGSTGSTATGGSTATAMASASPAPTGTLPYWASTLGSGITVVAPQSASPGHGSPAAAVAGVIAAFEAKNYAKSCSYAEPSVQTRCESLARQVPVSQIPTFKNAMLGYVVIDGDRAAVGMTGTACTPGNSPECATNTDPAAVFSTAKSFSAIWSNAIKQTSGYSRAPCIKVGGKWYVYSATS
jgi:hypothetical protein